MTYFYNPFTFKFIGNWVLGDRQFSPSFVCDGNKGRTDESVLSWADGPFNLSGNDADGDSTNTLVLKYAVNTPFERWTTLSINIAAGAASSSAVTTTEIITALNADTTFSSWFTAALNNNRVSITSKKSNTQFRFYVVHGRADTALLFNARVGIAELPTYFDRHKVTHLFADEATMLTFPDRTNILVPLDPDANDVDADLIDNAVDAKGNSLGYDSGTVLADWQLLKGRSGLFHFKKITVDGSNRITEIIEYPAGAKAGDLAKKTTHTYTSANTNPSKTVEIPYTLASGDLVTP